MSHDYETNLVDFITDIRGQWGLYIDLSRAPYVLYGVKHIDLVSLSRLAGDSLDTHHGQ